LSGTGQPSQEISKPLLRVFLVRHGEVENAHEMRLDGHKDVALSQKGEEQMAFVASELAQRPLNAVYASDLYRSRRGAELTAQKLGLTVKTDPAFREIDFGDLAGLNWKMVMEKLGGKQERLLNLIENRFPGGENLIDFQNRVMPAYRQIAAQEKGEVALFAHGGTNRMILYQELGIGLNNFLRFEQSYACVNVIDYFALDTKVLKLLNADARCLRNFEPV